MKTATLDVGGMLSMLDYQGVERQLGRLPGVHHATASIASSSATIEYGDAVTSVAALKDKINECGFHCTGQIMPKHVCEPHAGHAHDQGMHAGHAAAMKPADSRPQMPAGREAHEHHVHAALARAPAAATPAIADVARHGA